MTKRQTLGERICAVGVKQMICLLLYETITHFCLNMRFETQSILLAQFMYLVTKDRHL